MAVALPVTEAISIEMDGDGGIKIRSSQNVIQYIFKPVNLQALWYVSYHLSLAPSLWKLGSDGALLPQNLSS